MPPAVNFTNSFNNFIIFHSFVQLTYCYNIKNWRQSTNQAINYEFPVVNWFDFWNWIECLQSKFINQSINRNSLIKLAWFDCRSQFSFILLLQQSFIQSSCLNRSRLKLRQPLNLFLHWLSLISEFIIHSFFNLHFRLLSSAFIINSSKHSIKPDCSLMND